jgi:ABC-2 type transport system ATP-binding protein
MSGEAISLQGVGKQFGDIRALQGADLEVGRGEVFGFLGPNGAGKTTTIRILTGFIHAGAGEARVLGFDPWRQAVEAKRRVGFLPDHLDVGGNFTGIGFLDHVARLRGYRSAPPFRAPLLDRLELSEAALVRKVKGYSTGMRKKLAIVQAMQHGPDLLIMDEPTESLDPLMRQALFDLFR